MPFDCSHPFVREVYRFVENRQLYQCVKFLEDYLNKQPKTPMHWLVGKSFRRFLSSYSKWLMNACKRMPEPGSTVAVCASMGELEINYNNWTASAAFYPDYNEPDNTYAWLCESHEKCQGLGDWYTFKGLHALISAFEYAMDYNDDDPSASLPVPSETFTAVSYLFFVRFLELNRGTHRIAAKHGSPLARCHLFCDYGDLLFHSRPKRIAP